MVSLCQLSHLISKSEIPHLTETSRFFIAFNYFFSYFKMLSNDGNSFHLKKGRFTEFIDGRLPMDRERKFYCKEKDIDPTIRMSASKDNLNSSIYLRA